jgi:hypothetical protein
MLVTPSRETNHSGDEETNRRKINPMGDKSPKSVQKQASQKQTKASSAVQKKQAAATAKQAVGKKK